MLVRDSRERIQPAACSPCKHHALHKALSHGIRAVAELARAFISRSPTVHKSPSAGAGKHIQMAQFVHPSVPSSAAREKILEMWKDGCECSPAAYNLQEIGEFAGKDARQGSGRRLCAGEPGSLWS
jgi:hypothetical protein